MIKVEITQNQTRLITRSGTTRDGRQYTMQEQHAYIYLGGDYPTEFAISIPQGHSAYPSGFYTLGAGSLRVGQFSKLEINREIQLLPLDSKK